MQLIWLQNINVKEIRGNMLAIYTNSLTRQRWVAKIGSIQLAEIAELNAPINPCRVKMKQMILLIT